MLSERLRQVRLRNRLTGLMQFLQFGPGARGVGVASGCEGRRCVVPHVRSLIGDCLMAPTASVVVSGVVMLGSLALAGDVTSTRLSGFPIDWSQASKWDHDVPGVSSFPNNGNEGRTYDVVFTNNLIDLDVPVTVDSIAGQYDIHLNGGTLTVLNEMGSSFGYLRGGSISAGSMRATSTMLLDAVQGTVGPLTLENNADLRLQGGTNVTMGDITFTGDGDVYSNSGALPTLNLAGRTITKSGGNSTSDIQVLVLGSDLSVVNSMPGTSIRFGQHELEFGTLNLAVGGSTIEFSDDLTLGDVTVSSVEAGGTPQVILRGDVTLNGTLSHPLGSGGYQDVVVLTAAFGTGRLSGGTLACTGSARFLITGDATLCEDGSVTNTGNVRWQDGTIKGSDFINTGLLDIDAPGVRRLENATLVNRGVVFHDAPVHLSTSGSIIVENAGRGTSTWRMSSSVLPLDDVVAPGTSFRNESRLDLDATGTVGVPYVSTSDARISTSNKTLTLSGSADLQGSIHALGGNVTLAPDPWAATLPSHVDVEISAFSDSTSHVEVLTIPSGEVMLTRIATPQTVFEARARVTGDAVVRGGTIALTDPTRFVQDGGTVGEGSTTTNSGRYRFMSGTIGLPGLMNTATLDIDTPATDGTVRIEAMANTGEVSHARGEVIVGATGITNAGRWWVPAFRHVMLRYPGASGFSPFVNTGKVEAYGFGSLECRVVFDNQGLVMSEGAIIRFTGNVLQYDKENKRLTGGSWETRDGGEILFVDEGTGEVHDIVAPASVKLKNSSPGPTEPWSSIDGVGGTLGITGTSTLDLTSNASGGDLQIFADAEVFAGEVVLRGTVPEISLLLAQRINCLGTMTALDGAVFSASTDVQLLSGGVLRGDRGLIDTPLLCNLSGCVAPGEPISEESGLAATYGVLELTGDYRQELRGRLDLEIGGTEDGQFDQLAVSGSVSLGGTLKVDAPRDLDVEVGTSWPVVEGASITGNFAHVSLPVGYDLVQRSTRVMVRYTGPCPADLNGDGEVDMKDVTRFVETFNSSGADLNGDGVTNAADFSILRDAFGSRCGAS